LGERRRNRKTSQSEKGSTEPSKKKMTGDGGYRGRDHKKVPVQARPAGGGVSRDKTIERGKSLKAYRPLQAGLDEGRG